MKNLSHIVVPQLPKGWRWNVLEKDGILWILEASENIIAGLYSEETDVAFVKVKHTDIHIGFSRLLDKIKNKEFEVRKI